MSQVVMCISVLFPVCASPVASLRLWVIRMNTTCFSKINDVRSAGGKTLALS